MPRDLAAERNNAVQQVENRDEPTQVSSPSTDTDMLASPSPQPDTQSTPRPATSAVKPYVQSLTTLDLESCVKLEEATFPPQERCSREKLEYRLTKCGELSIGLFTSADTQDASTAPAASHSTDPSTAVTASTAQPVYSGTPHRKQVLLGHVLATKTDNATVNDDDMALPDDSTKSGTSSAQGHKEHGRTLCIHSLAVLPPFQHQGLGRLLMRSYIQRMESSGVADRIAILTHEPLISFYESLGFQNRGSSKTRFGGGGWYDLVLDLKASV